MNEYDEKIFENVSMTIRECVNDQDIHIELSSTLAEDLDIDSSDGYCLIMELEEIYNIVIDDKVIETLTTVESVVNLIKERIEQA
jgi:acyl carrier protein